MLFGISPPLGFPSLSRKAGREKALEEFTLDRMLRETERVCQEALGLDER